MSHIIEHCKKITVYLGSSGRCRQIFKDEAIKLGKRIAQEGKILVFGGMGTGLMGEVANACMKEGGKIIGVIPSEVRDMDAYHAQIEENIIVPKLCERKRLLFLKGDIVAVLPGGFGTLDEFAEVLYWAKLGLHKKPLVFINVDHYWDDVLAHLDTLSDIPLGAYTSVNNVDEFMEYANTAISEEVSENTSLPTFEPFITKATRTPIIIDEDNIDGLYLLANSLSSKQIGGHSRPIGLLNRGGCFDLVLDWMDHAEEEHFITDKCQQLFSHALTEKALMKSLENQHEIVIDLIHEKWGIEDS